MSRLRHLQLVGGVEASPYTHHGSGGGEPFQSPPRDRAPHAQALKAQVRQAEHQANEELGASVEQSSGIQLTFESAEGFDLLSDSLDNRTIGLRLLSVVNTAEGQRAVVFVPRGAIEKVIRKINDYESRLTRFGQPMNKSLVESIERARLSIARDMWTDGRPFPEGNAAVWWEAWLRADVLTEQQAYDRFAAAATISGLSVSRQTLAFPERVVTLVKATSEDWSQARLLLEYVAELRYPAEATTPYLEMPPREQAEHIEDLVGRLQPATPFAPAVCVLDTGVMREHPLLRDSILESDAHAVRPEWTSVDHDPHQHGTGMAGNALLGCLTEPLRSTEPVVLQHRLESVKILPPTGANDPELYGDTVAQAIARVEIAAPERARVACMAITDRSLRLLDGEPTAWSAAIDKIAWNEGNDTRLICVSAGNLRDEMYSGYQYLRTNASDVGTIEDPSQSWNALTVGAYTARTAITRPDYSDWQPLAQAGGLGPVSRTTAAWDPADGETGSRSSWPFKPDIVLEGGNWAAAPDGSVDRLVDTALLTTAMTRTGRLLDFNGDTSAATALAARASAIVKAAYPTLRAETIRGLLVHVANWTPQMLADCPGTQRRDVVRRLRMCGYGVPDVERALWSVRNAVTLVSQGQIQPYYLRDSRARSKQMVLHSLPWPRTVLEELGDTPLELRVTLSYFIEPSPGRRGWTNSFRYASHGLRFELKRFDESVTAFKARLSADADEASDDTAEPDGDQWVVGKKARSRGSLHSDWWRGPARELALRDSLAIYPVTGWWRERKHLNRVDTVAPYAVLLSISSPAMDIDLYNAVVTETEIATPIEV